MARWGEFEYKVVEEVAKAFRQASDEKVVEGFIRDFLLEMANTALATIKDNTPVATGYLHNNWFVGKIEKKGDLYEIEIFNNVEYAGFVEYGFRSHWVPGRWEGDQFIYEKGAKTGMYVGKKNGWVEGRFMMRNGIKDIEEKLPAYLERRQVQLVEQILSGKVAKKKG